VTVTPAPDAGDASRRTVVVALLSNLGVAVAKLVAAVVTRSTATSAEASHALADTGNQVLLVVAQRSSIRPRDDRHPFGYGREAHFWALIASVVVFVAAAVFSLREGITELVHPVRATSFVVVYLVLAVSIVLDSASLLSAAHQLRAEAACASTSTTGCGATRSSCSCGRSRPTCSSEAPTSAASTSYRWVPCPPERPTPWRCRVWLLTLLRTPVAKPSMRYRRESLHGRRIRLIPRPRQQLDLSVA
jgi:hypothetical protein